MTASDWWRQDGDDLLVQVRATPGARRSEVQAVVDGRLRVRVGAPAVDGKANVELARVVAAWAGVRRGAVTVERGDRSREKTLRIRGLDRPPPAD